MKNKKSEDIDITFTSAELREIHNAIDNSYGNGDWLEFLDMDGESNEQEKAFYKGWSKIKKALWSRSRKRQ